MIKINNMIRILVYMLMFRYFVFCIEGRHIREVGDRLYLLDRFQ